jgi:hypothetical protein
LQVKYGEHLARKLGATCVVLEAAHFVSRECGHEVNLMLENVILGQARAAERAHLDPSRHLSPELPPEEVEAVRVQLTSLNIGIDPDKGAESGDENAAATAAAGQGCAHSNGASRENGHSADAQHGGEVSSARAVGIASAMSP